MSEKLSGAKRVIDAYFQCGWKGKKRSGRFGGCTVALVLAEVVKWRDNNQPRDDLFVAVHVKRDDGLIARYSAKLPPGATRAVWDLSG